MEFSGADPVISSHWDGLLPPGKKMVINEILLHIFRVAQ